MAKRTPCAGPIPYTPPTGPTFAEVRARLQKQVLDGETVTCPCCEQRVRKLNKHRMDVAKLQTLIEVAKLHQKGAEWVKIQRDHRLIKKHDAWRTLQQDAIHASRLKWFGLLHYNGVRTGEFQVSELGWQFLAGHVTVPAWILTRQGEVWEESAERLSVGQINLVLDKAYWDEYWREQQNPRRL